MRASSFWAGDRRWLFALAIVTLTGLGLRLWGISWGLPFAYNLDERAHFVPRAVGFFQTSSLDPDYQLNPSGLMLWIAGALWLFQGGRGGVLDAWVSRAGFDGQLSAWRAERASRKDVPIWPEDGSTRRS